MLKIRLKTKSGYRLTKISNENFIYYRKTKQGYSKKSELQIKKLHEKVVEQKAIIRQKQKLVTIREYQKTKQLAKKRFKGIRKPKEIREYQEEIKEIPRHQTVVYEFNCLVSDRKINHLFAFREEAEKIFGSIEAIHNDNYPDHIVIDYKFNNTFSTEDKGSFSNNQITQKQKEFLNNLGFSHEEISLISDKKFASKIISKKRR